MDIFELRSKVKKLADDDSTSFPFVEKNRTTGYMYFGHGMSICKDEDLVLKKVPANCVLITLAQCGSETDDTNDGTLAAIRAQYFCSLDLDNLLREKKVKGLFKPELGSAAKLVFTNNRVHVMYPGDIYVDSFFVARNSTSNDGDNVSDDPSRFSYSQNGLITRSSILKGSMHTRILHYVDDYPRWFEEFGYNAFSKEGVYRVKDCVYFLCFMMYKNSEMPTIQFMVLAANAQLLQIDNYNMDQLIKDKDLRTEFLSRIRRQHADPFIDSLEADKGSVLKVFRPLGTLDKDIFLLIDIISQVTPLMKLSDMMEDFKGVHFWPICRSVDVDCVKAASKRRVNSGKYSPGGLL